MTEVGTRTFEHQPAPPVWVGGRQEKEIQWYALWTRSHCERLVQEQLSAEGFETFLPEIDVWLRQRGEKRSSRVPLFPGYLFLHHAMDKASYIAASKARGLVCILGQRWDRLESVPEHEIESVRKVLGARMNPVPYPYLREGERVRIKKGPLAGVEGILLRINAERGLLVISIDLFQRSLSVEVDCTFAAAA